MGARYRPPLRRNGRKSTLPGLPRPGKTTKGAFGRRRGRAKTGKRHVPYAARPRLLGGRSEKPQSRPCRRRPGGAYVRVDGIYGDDGRGFPPIGVEVDDGGFRRVVRPLRHYQTFVAIGDNRHVARTAFCRGDGNTLGFPPRPTVRA